MTHQSKAIRILERIRELDYTKSETLLGVAKLLCQMKNAQLHRHLGYETFNAMVEAELPFTANMANRYTYLHTHIEAKKYTEKQAIALVSEHSVHIVNRFIGRSKRKLTPERINELMSTESPKEAIACAFTATDMKRIEKALQRHGMQYSGSHRRNISAALMDLIEDYERLVHVVEKDPTIKRRAEALAHA